MSDHIADGISRDQWKDIEEVELRKLAQRLDVVEENFKLEKYTPPGPVARDFIASNGKTEVIMGPLGGGKTTTCVFKRIKSAAILAPICWHPDDNVPTRMCKWIVLRDTFRSVEKTVLSSWNAWFSKTYPGSKWTGGNDRPAIHTLRFMGGDGIRIEAITEFAGLNGENIEAIMKGREYSGAWLNELDTHDPESLGDVEQRVGRYPREGIILSQQELADLSHARGVKITSKQTRTKIVIGDMNAPTVDNWTYEALVTKIKPGRNFFQQPSGVSNLAENRLNLDRNYYTDLIANQPDWKVRRLVFNEFGYSRKGKPVHETFSHAVHVAKHPLDFNPQLDLLIGIDISTNALTPAAIIGQNPGRITILDELYPGQGHGPVRFGELLKQMLDEHYPNRRKVRVWCDPAAQYGGDKEGGQLAALEILTNILKVPVEIPFGGSNELSLRLETVNMELRGYLEPDTSMIISPSCPQFIAAMGGKYRFKKLTSQSTNEYADLPEKSHPHSDLADACQYLIGGVRGRSAIISAGGDQRQRRGRVASGGNAAQKVQGWGRVIPGNFDPRKVGF